MPPTDTIKILKLLSLITSSLMLHNGKNRAKRLNTGEDGTPVRASPRRETVYRPQPVILHISTEMGKF